MSLMRSTDAMMPVDQVLALFMAGADSERLRRARDQATETTVARLQYAWEVQRARVAHIHRFGPASHTCWRDQGLTCLDQAFRFYGCMVCGRSHWCKDGGDHCVQERAGGGEHVCVFTGRSFGVDHTGMDYQQLVERMETLRAHGSGSFAKKATIADEQENDAPAADVDGVMDVHGRNLRLMGQAHNLPEGAARRVVRYREFVCRVAQRAVARFEAECEEVELRWTAPEGQGAARSRAWRRRILREARPRPLVVRQTWEDGLSEEPVQRIVAKIREDIEQIVTAVCRAERLSVERTNQLVGRYNNFAQRLFALLFYTASNDRALARCRYLGVVTLLKLLKDEMTLEDADGHAVQLWAPDAWLTSRSVATHLEAMCPPSKAVRRPVVQKKRRVQRGSMVGGGGAQLVGHGATSTGYAEYVLAGGQHVHALNNVRKPRVTLGGDMPHFSDKQLTHWRRDIVLALQQVRHCSPVVIREALFR